MEIIAFLGPLGIAVIVIAILVFSGLKVIQEYERGVLFRLGKLAGARGPGLTYVIPGVERLVKIDLRVITMDVPRYRDAVFGLPVDVLHSGLTGKIDGKHVRSAGILDPLLCVTGAGHEQKHRWNEDKQATEGSHTATS